MRTRRPKHTVEHVAAFFKSQGCLLLSKIYLGNKQQLKYRCKCGAIRFTCFNNFVRGYRCMKCYLKRIGGGQKRYKIIKLRDSLFTINDLATIMGVTYDAVWKAIRSTKIIPAPTHSCGSVRKYYSAKDIDKILEMVEVE